MLMMGTTLSAMLCEVLQMYIGKRDNWVRFRDDGFPQNCGLWQYLLNLIFLTVTHGANTDRSWRRYTHLGICAKGI